MHDASSPRSRKRMYSRNSKAPIFRPSIPLPYARRPARTARACRAAIAGGRGGLPISGAWPAPCRAPRIDGGDQNAGGIISRPQVSASPNMRFIF